MHAFQRHAGLVIVFLLSYLLLFATMSLRPGSYDEGIILTGALRVAAGQIPHRDFYFIYGPAQLYALAALFKAFGVSLLTERLYDLSIKALIVTLLYAIVSSYCHRTVAIVVSLLALLWLGSLDYYGLAIFPVSLLNLAASALLLPVYAGRIAARRLLAAGAVSGGAFLFRYDTGTALLGIHLCVMAIAVFQHEEGMANRLRSLAATTRPYLLGFALVTLPPVLCYFAVASPAAWIHDVIIYPSIYYHRSRNLPFPRPGLRWLEGLEIYLLVAIAGVSLYCLLARSWSNCAGTAECPEGKPDQPPWQGVLITFALLLIVMYLKGLVRVGLAQMYLAMIPSLVLVAVLFEYRSAFSRPLQRTISCLMSFSVLTALSASLHAAQLQQWQHSSLAENTWSGRQIHRTSCWCQLANPLTRGICFLPEEDRMHAFAFLVSHVRPGEPFYSGLKHHDRIVGNDDLVYFAIRCLPATHWSHFDPGLQTRLDIQSQIVQELARNSPRYIEIDAELDQLREPNGSAVSSGVTLLDDYIHDKYQPVATFGAISIWQRRCIPVTEMRSPLYFSQPPDTERV